MEANNMKAMREAVKSLMDNLKIHLSQPIDQITINRAELEAMVKDCSEALAKPPRNCDVGTARQQERRHKKEVCPKSACPKHEGFVSKACRGCFAMWAQMPYNESEAGK